ncbi:MAG: hypothetical protein HY465_01520 [Deltaproteobacteria bacterium]|nr:hypothetical protein [Deltaproteobacteria bacterium]
MFTHGLYALPSLPDRFGNTLHTLFTADSTSTFSAAIADVPFLIMEGWGWVSALKGAQGAVRGRQPTTTPVEAYTTGGPGGFSSSAGVAVADFCPAAAVEVASVVETGGAVAISGSGDFGGPMGTPQAVHMNRRRSADDVKESSGLFSTDEALAAISDEIKALRKSPSQAWKTVADLAEQLSNDIQDASASSRPRKIRMALRSVYGSLRSWQHGLNPQQVTQQLNTTRSIFETGESFKAVGDMRKAMVTDAARAARRSKPPPLPKPPRYEIVVEGCPESMAPLIQEYNVLIREFKAGNFANVAELRTVVTRILRDYDRVSQRNNIETALLQLNRSLSPQASSRFHRAHKINPQRVSELRGILYDKFLRNRDASLTAVPHDQLDRGRRLPSLEEMDGDHTRSGGSWGGED